ncbi:endonuclease/exonuclease/phosphatase family protein [Brevibacillus migulae]|uniref:endonuclease/exonuclease/phosphatase family protein n=1 Tax=Brevibacillus migulae TaxID=1644114 RepID=UPI00106E5D73|nr:endonuclease/exonuclease/phosphatase family protein [Brevibacillus migulae]
MKKKTVFTLALFMILGAVFLIQGRIESKTAMLPSPPPKDDKTLTLVTYNIRGARDDAGEADPVAIADELRMTNADIIALQEVDNGLPRSDFGDQAKIIAEKLGMNYVFAPAINFLVGTYGNALLSRYPILSSTSVDLPYLLEPRSLLQVEMDLGGQKLIVFTTHLGLKKSERIKQFEFLYDYLEDYTGKPVVFMGDFNTRADDPLFTPIRTLLQDPLFKRKQRLVTISGKVTYGTIDHIFLSPHLHDLYAYAPSFGRSDHFPVSMRVELDAWK